MTAPAESRGLQLHRRTYSDDPGGSPRPVLVWTFGPPVRSIATTVLGGGLGHCSWVINAEVDREYHHHDPAVHAAEIGRSLGLADAGGVGLLTAARVDGVVTADDGGVSCDATVGVSHPVWAAAVPGDDTARVVGTINLVCWMPVGLRAAALVNAVVTATEAKTQALVQAGVDGTGTASDAVVICCPVGGDEQYGGPRSRWGARLARCVHAAVAAGLARPGAAS